MMPLMLPYFEEIKSGQAQAYAKSFYTQYSVIPIRFTGKAALVEPMTENTCSWCRTRRRNRLSKLEMDQVYDLAVYADVSSYL